MIIIIKMANFIRYANYFFNAIINKGEDYGRNSY